MPRSYSLAVATALLLSLAAASAEAGNTLKVKGYKQLGAGLQEPWVLTFPSALSTDTDYLISTDMVGCLVAPDGASDGNSSLFSTAPAGTKSVTFYVQATDAARGYCDVSAYTDTHEPGGQRVEVVQAGLQFRRLSRRHRLVTTRDPRPFTVQVGVPKIKSSTGEARAVRRRQGVRVDGTATGLFTVVCCRDPAVATVESVDDPGENGNGCANIIIPVGAYEAEGIILPLSIGECAVEATGPTVLTTSKGARTIRVK